METDWVRNYIVKTVWSGVERESLKGDKRGASGIMLWSTPTMQKRLNASYLYLKCFSTLLSTFLERTVMR